MQGTSAVTYNMDVLIIVRLLNRFIEEVSHSQSAGTTQATAADIARLTSYTVATRTYATHAINQPVLDLPETHPKTIDLPSLSEIPEMENDAFFAAAMLLETARDEIIKSASTRLSTNLITFDSARLFSILDKCDALVTGYIQTATPIDLPESSPRAAMPPAGR